MRHKSALTFAAGISLIATTGSNCPVIAADFLSYAGISHVGMITAPALPAEETFFDTWSNIGQSHHWKRDNIGRHRIPGRIETQAQSQWLTGSTAITSHARGSFRSDIRFSDTADPASNAMVPASLNLRVRGAINFYCSDKNLPASTFVQLTLTVKLNGVTQTGAYKIDSDLVVTQSGLLGGLAGTVLVDGADTPNGRGFDEMVVTAPVMVPVNQPQTLEVFFEVVSAAKGTGVCSITIARFLDGVGFPFGQDVFTGVPANISVNSSDLFLRNNRWGPLLNATPNGDNIDLSWPALLLNTMSLQRAPSTATPIQWTTVTDSPIAMGDQNTLSISREGPFQIFRLKEE